jgi:hypothetical protein
MNFLKNLFSSSKQEKGKKYPGGSFLEVALKESYRRLGQERIDNLYRASLLGGDVGARLMLANDERCLQKWEEGNLSKAISLLEVWASTAVLRLLQHQDDQESVRCDTARSFSLLFNSDEGELDAELLAYQEAIRAETVRRGEPGVRSFSNEILYLRTLRALDDEGVPTFKLLPVPWDNLLEMMEADPKLVEVLDVNILLPLDPKLLVLDVLISTLQTAQDNFKRLEVKG